MEVQQPDRWGIVVLIGVLLALISLAVSDLAPDAHVQLALHANEDDGRARLPGGMFDPSTPLPPTRRQDLRSASLACWMRHGN